MKNNNSNNDFLGGFNTLVGLAGLVGISTLVLYIQKITLYLEKNPDVIIILVISLLLFAYFYFKEKNIKNSFIMKDEQYNDYFKVYNDKGVLKSIYNLYNTGYFKGLWTGKSLKSQIISNYKTSKIIKIKVTRGINLFGKSNKIEGIFHQLIFNKESDSKKHIRVLLHYPCLESPHIKARALANTTSTEKYVENIFEVLKEFYKHSKASTSENPNTRQNETIVTKFYIDDKKSLRNYIFIKNDNKKELFFNHYKKTESGASGGMIKVSGGEGKHTLCDATDERFDYIFEHESVELISNAVDHKFRLMDTTFCGHENCKKTIKEIYDNFDFSEIKG